MIPRFENVEEIEVDNEDDWVRGSFVFKDYERNKRGDKTLSDPIIVEGSLYKLVFWPHGANQGSRTHISV